MNLTTRIGTRRSRPAAGLAVLALSLSLGLTACGNEADEPAATEAASPAEESMAEDEMNSMEGEEAAENMGAGAQTFGPGCASIPSDGAGSFDGMATEPVATAASANPLLKTLVTAVGEAKLVDTLNSAEDVTVFAPTDDAFGKIPPKDLKAVLKDKDTLTRILSHHVVAGQLAPEDLAGRHETLAGTMLRVQGSGEEFMVGEQDAAVLCGNIPTANATVYVVDTVLMP